MQLQKSLTEAPKTALEAIQSPGFSIVNLKKEAGEDVLDGALELLVADLIESFNIGKTMNGMQAKFTAQAIKDDYYYLKLEEIKFVFSQAKKGKYGVMYDRIDCAVICEWLEKYVTDREDILIQKNVEQAKEKAKEVQNDWAGLSKQLKQMELSELRKEVVERAKKPREKTEEEILVQDIFKEFETLYKDQSDIRPGDEAGRFVRYNDQHLDIESFLRLKLEESAKL
jgi:hypothetical protein